MKVQKDLRRVLSRMEINMVFRVTAAKTLSSNRILKLFLIETYGLKCLALLDSAATPNEISLDLLKKIGLRARPTKIGFTVASEDHVNREGILKDFLLRFDNLITTVELLAV